MIRVGIIGATGYAGGELVRILLGHKDVEIKWFGSRSYIDQKYASVYRNISEDKLVESYGKASPRERCRQTQSRNKVQVPPHAPVRPCARNNSS